MSHPPGTLARSPGEAAVEGLPLQPGRRGRGRRGGSDGRGRFCRRGQLRFPCMRVGSRGQQLVGALVQLAQIRKALEVAVGFDVLDEGAVGNGHFRVGGTRRTGERMPWANPGTVTIFPANGAGNMVTVPGLPNTLEGK